MTDFLTRREFISALAASVVAVGAPLPIGFPERSIIFTGLDLAEKPSLSTWVMYKYMRNELQLITGTLHTDYIKVILK